MGNDQSQIPGIEIEQKVIEVSDFWSQHKASINNLENVTKLSIFIGDLFINETFWAPQTPLEKFGKNLMIYRHPSIVRFISSWQKTSKFYLAVEEVTPLSRLLSQMSTMEICLGLYSILKALLFLHEKASVSHNNICMASIFVGQEGNWKVGGMEYLCRYQEMSADYLKRSRSHRYSKAVDANEDKLLKVTGQKKDFVDVYAFSTLAIELLKSKSDDEIPNLSSFKTYCTKAVQEPNLSQRPSLCSLLDHDFFKHKFISIHSFLIELPLKSDPEKMEFFGSLKNELVAFDEEIVASQLGKLLVSRMVLLNKTAGQYLLPYILRPKTGDNDAIFSESIFKKYIAPKLLNVFCVRDAQIRLLLLHHFPHLINCYTKEELQLHILPELLVGIKDTDNDLVAATLHTLAELVPILGANVVIGGKRARLFNDGRPKNLNTSRRHSNKKREFASNANPVEELHHQDLPERPRPDGEEGETSTDEIEQSADEDADNWEDWDNDNLIENEQSPGQPTLVTSEDIFLSTEFSSMSLDRIKSNSTNTSKPKKIVDITELDIKNQTKIELEKNEVDFFEDMEPVIENSNKFLVNNKNEVDDFSLSTKLSVNVDVNEDGWGDDW